MINLNSEKSVWIVDDDEGISDVLCLLLEEEGYKITVINDGNKVVNQIQQRKPDVMLLDVLMSGVDGRDVCKAIKSKSDTKNIPVIMMTADMHAEDKALEAGADAFIKKPFNIDEVLTLVKKQLKIH